MTNPDGSGLPPRPPDQIGPQSGYPSYPPPHIPRQYGPLPGHPPTFSYPKPPASPRKPRSPWIVGGIVAASVVLLAVAGYAITDRGALGLRERTLTVTYEITGDPGPVEITYTDAKGHLSHPQIVALPWRMQMSVTENNKSLLFVEAERTDSSKGSLACRVVADDASLDQMRSVTGLVVCGSSPAGG